MKKLVLFLFIFFLSSSYSFADNVFVDKKSINNIASGTYYIMKSDDLSHPKGISRDLNQKIMKYLEDSLSRLGFVRLYVESSKSTANYIIVYDFNKGIDIDSQEHYKDIYLNLSLLDNKDKSMPVIFTAESKFKRKKHKNKEEEYLYLEGMVLCLVDSMFNTQRKFKKEFRFTADISSYKGKYKCI